MTLSANAMEDQTASTETDPADATLFTRYRRTQFIVVVASILCFLLFWYVGQGLHIPAERGFEDSLLQQPYWPLHLITIYVLILVCATLGTLIAGRSWFFAGIFAAATGLMALSLRGGPMRYVLFRAASDGATHSIFLRLAFEQCLLFIPVGLTWFFFHRGYESALPPLATDDDKRPTAGSTPMALFTQLVSTTFLLLLLTPTDAKKQVLVSAFISCFAGAALAEYLVPDRKAPAWYWAAPLLVGVFGYIMAFLNAGDVTTGTATGFFAHLAYPLPLDYASAGVAGTLLGYWTGAERPRVNISVLRSVLRGCCGSGRTLPSSL